MTPAVYYFPVRVLPRPNLVAIEHSWAIWPLLETGDPCMTSNISIVLYFGQVFFLPNLVAMGYSCTIYPWLTPSWPLYELWPKKCWTLQSGVFPTKFGGHKVFLKELDLWMTIDLWCDRFIWGFDTFFVICWRWTDSGVMLG